MSGAEPASAEARAGVVLREFAAAKVNLTLHVTGRRPDGYHLLDSLVCFAAVGDWLELRPGPGGAVLEIDGPEACSLQGGGDNLVLRAAAAFGPAPAGALLRLTKALPVASGIGGGSADAAAALRGLSRLWARPWPEAARVLALGADVPVCLAGRVCRMSGVGEDLAPVPALPPVWAVLANPRVEVSTPAVFKALQSRDNPAMPGVVPAFADATGLAGWLAAQRNDLEAPARALAPEISGVIAALGALPGALLARMSGSGATCFALFPSAALAAAGAAALSAAHPGWWVAAAALGDAAALQPDA